MCPPGLHTTLVIFLKLVLLMEDECNKLDHRTSMPESNSGESYKHYCSDMKNKQVMDQLYTVKESIKMLEEILFHHLSLTSEELADG